MPACDNIWVLGGGQFGRRAVKLLRQKAPTATITVVDNLPIRNLPDDIKVVRGDAVDWFVEQFTPDARVSRIVPALPRHLATEWLKKSLSTMSVTVHAVEIPEELLRHFPNPFRTSPSQIAVSHADFLCPPDCPEPHDFCTVTQQPRPIPLYQLLGTSIYGSFTPVIIRSRQFAVGVGGFQPEDLWSLMRRATSMPEIPLLIGTACKCHGIVDGLIITKNTQQVHFNGYTTQRR